MRGRIIHYNSNDGRGLISDGGKQYPFEVSEWQSATAPALNTVVEFNVNGERPEAVKRVPDETLLREKAGELAGRFGSLAGKAHIGSGNALASGTVTRLGRPLLIAHAAFVVGALMLTYLRMETLWAGRAYTLSGLSRMSDMGADVGSAALVWVAILSPLVPILWRNRWAWAALALPLVAVVTPWFQLRSELSRLASASGMALGGPELAAQMQKQMSAMAHFGLGAWVCGLAAILVAVIGLQRMARTAD